jgi:hypothetical protein
MFFGGGICVGGGFPATPSNLVFFFKDLIFKLN